MLILLLACADLAESDDVLHTNDGRDPDGHDTDGDDTGRGEDTGSESDDETGENETDSGEPDCPEGVTCIDSFPWGGSGNTGASNRSDFDSYACSPSTDESGPEQVYRLTVPEGGLLAIALDENGSGVDVDVHLLRSLDSDDCIDRGNSTAASLVGEGTWYVVIDSWVNSEGESLEGAYDLWMNVTTADAYERDGLDADVLDLGLTAFDNGWKAGETDRLEYTIIDFSKPSDEHRKWTFDLADGSLLYSLLVSHGEGSGSSSDARYADKFSNTDGSHMSSLGLMRTASRYDGSNGNSLTLEGLEQGINDAAEARYIVVHGADYATQEFVDDYGYLGRSWGCPAVDIDIIDDFIRDVEEGTLYWSYYPDPDFLADSDFL